jgi:hypothetical protein
MAKRARPRPSPADDLSLTNGDGRIATIAGVRWARSPIHGPFSDILVNWPNGTPAGARSDAEQLFLEVIDSHYRLADRYLAETALKSGGRLIGAETIKNPPRLFAELADELRTQYLLGYYPLDDRHDDRYRKIEVETSRREVVLQARPGYRLNAIDRQ